jgi:hypothetical protein
LIDRYETDWKFEIAESRKAAKLNEEPNVVTNKYTAKPKTQENKTPAPQTKKMGRNSFTEKGQPAANPIY